MSLADFSAGSDIEAVHGEPMGYEVGRVEPAVDDGPGAHLALEELPVLSRDAFARLGVGQPGDSLGRLPVFCVAGVEEHLVSQVELTVGGEARHSEVGRPHDGQDRAEAQRLFVGNPGPYQRRRRARRMQIPAYAKGPDR